MDNKKRYGLQALAALIQNCNFIGFFTGDIYKGNTKAICVPGINCYSCPGAIASCPIGAIQNSLSSWKFKIPYYVIGLIIFFGTLLGRIVCGFLCPFGFLQEMLNLIPFPKKIRKFLFDFQLRKVRWAVLLLLVVALPSMIKLTPFFCKYICPSGTIAGLMLSSVDNELFFQFGSIFAWKISVLLVIIVASIVIFRPFCKYICPLGLIYGWFNRVSLFSMEIDQGKCTGCGVCEKVCGMCVNPAVEPNHSECIRCMGCVRACPNGALTFGPRISKTKDKIKK